eukprot:15341556-Ditylum_brightwellii.AAC.1
MSTKPTLKTIISKAKNLSLDKEWLGPVMQEVLSSYKIALPMYVHSLIYTASSVESYPNVLNVESRTDLDTHAKIPMIGNNMLILGHTENKLIPPFMMREAGLAVKDTPKIYVSGPR